MGRKTNSKRSKLIALFAVILAAVGALVLMPKPAVAEGETTGTLTIKKVSTNTQASFDLDITIDGDTSGVTYKINGGESKPWTDKPTAIQNGQTIEISGIPFASGEQENLTVKETSSGYNTYATYGMAASAADIAENLANFTDNTFRGGIVSDTPYASLTIYNMVPTIETQVSPSTITPTSEGYVETITDNVKVTGLVPGKTYTVVGELMDGTTPVPNTRVTVNDATADKDGNLDVTPEYKDVPVGKYAGKKLVAYATVKDGDNVVIEHKDDKDEKQTVTIKEIPGSLSITKTLKTPTTDSHIANPTGETDEEKAADKKKWETRKEKAQNQLNDAKPAFTFTVELKDASGKALEDEYKYSGAAEGTVKNGGTISIPATELDSTATITIEGLPEGATYNVTEVDTEGYKAINNKKSDTGTIEKGKTAVADFTNAPLGTLKVIKNVKVTVYDLELEAANKIIEETQKQMDATTDSTTREAYQILLDEENKYKEELEKKKAEIAATEFTFTITLTDADKKALTETKEYKTVKSDGTTDTDGTIKFEDGKSATVKLKGGESIRVIGMDPDYNVSVAETPVDGWVANHKSLSGTVIEGVPLTATFENTYAGADTPTPGDTPSGNSTTKSSTKLANTADPVVDAALIAAASAPAVLSGLALRRRK